MVGLVGNCCCTSSSLLGQFCAQLVSASLLLYHWQYHVDLGRGGMERKKPIVVQHRPDLDIYHWVVIQIGEH